MKQITAFQAEDGTVYANKVDAAEHEARIALRIIVNRFELCGSLTESQKEQLVDDILEHGSYLNDTLTTAFKDIPIADEKEPKV